MEISNHPNQINQKRPTLRSPQHVQRRKGAAWAAGRARFGSRWRWSSRLINARGIINHGSLRLRASISPRYTLVFAPPRASLRAFSFWLPRARAPFALRSSAEELPYGTSGRINIVCSQCVWNSENLVLTDYGDRGWWVIENVENSSIHTCNRKKLNVSWGCSYVVKCI